LKKKKKKEEKLDKKKKIPLGLSSAGVFMAVDGATLDLV
jgi:hypothetical protein